MTYTPLTDEEIDGMTYEQIKAKVVRLNNDSVIATQRIDNLAKQYADASHLIEEAIENGYITDDELVDDLISMFNLQIERSVEITFNADITVNMKLNRGSELYSYDIDIPTAYIDGNRIDIVDCDINNINLDWQ